MRGSAGSSVAAKTEIMAASEAENSAISKRAIISKAPKHLPLDHKAATATFCSTGRL